MFGVTLHFLFTEVTINFKKQVRARDTFITLRQLNESSHHRVDA